MHWIRISDLASELGLSIDATAALFEKLGLPRPERYDWFQVREAHADLLRRRIGSAGTSRPTIESRLPPRTSEGLAQVDGERSREAPRERSQAVREERDSEAEWSERSFSVGESARWRSAGFTARGAERWRAGGFAPHEASRWWSHSLGPGTAREWSAVGVGPDEAVKWRAFTDSETARLWRSAGFTASAASPFITKGLGIDDAREQIRKVPVSERQLEPESSDSWEGDEDDSALADDDRQIPSRKSAFSAWVEKSERNMPRPFPNAAFALKGLYDRGRLWAPREHTGFLDLPNDEPDLNWVDEIVAIASIAAPQVHLAPEWPAIVEWDAWTIDLSVDDSIAIAWVGTAEGGVVVAFDVGSLDLWFDKDSPRSRLAAGLAMAWFIDVSIATSRSRGHPHFKRDTRDHIFRASSTFDLHVADVRDGRHKPPRAHRVRGHIRRLSNATPSGEARRNAPAYIRMHMSINDTFVRSHSRGGPVPTHATIARLQKISLLSDAIGLLKETGGQL